MSFKFHSDMNFLLAQVLIQFFYAVKLVHSIDISDYNVLQETGHAKKPVIPILKHSFEQHEKGYQYSYETGNGIHAEESGFIKNKGDKKHETLVQQGSVTYHDEHGHPITLTYIADEHGFQPQGDHLPTPPPIPPEIQKVIDLQHHKGEQVDYEEVEYEHQQQIYSHH